MTTETTTELLERLSIRSRNNFAAFMGLARISLLGVEYADVSDLCSELYNEMGAQGYAERECHLFIARCTIYLEGYRSEANLAMDGLMHQLEDFDFTRFTNN